MPCRELFGVGAALHELTQLPDFIPVFAAIRFRAALHQGLGEKNVAWHNSTNSIGSAPLRCAACLAIQRRLGLLSQRRIGPRIDHFAGTGRVWPIVGRLTPHGWWSVW